MTSMSYEIGSSRAFCSDSGSSLDNSPAVQPGWDRDYYAQQRGVLKAFMALQAQEETPPHVTTEDMKSWLTSKASAAFSDRFHKEISQGKDLCVAQLTWEVNTRLKLDEMERELKHGNMFPVSSASNEISPSIKPVRESPPCLHSTPNQVDLVNSAPSVSQTQLSEEAATLGEVHRALEDMLDDLTYLPASRPHRLSVVMVDLATQLLLSIGSYPASKEAVPLVDLVVWVITKALQELFTTGNFADAFRAADRIHVLFSKPVGVRIVKSLLGDLQRMAGGPAALKSLLSVREEALMRSVLSCIVINVVSLMDWTRCPSFGWTGPLLSRLSWGRKGVTSLLDRKAPACHAEIPVMDSATLNTIIMELLVKIFADAPRKVVSLILLDSPFLVDLENHLSAVLGMSVSSSERKASFSLKPAEVQVIVDSVYDQLERRSGAKIILQTSVSSKTQMVSRDIACLVVRALIAGGSSVISGGYSVTPGDCGEHCRVDRPKAEDYWTLASTGTVRDALFLHTVDRLVNNIFPIKPTVSMLGDDIRKRLCVSQQLWAVIQELWTKTPKSNALHQVLLNLPCSEQDMGEMDYTLGDMLFAVYSRAFGSEGPVDIDDFIEDEELCYTVSNMVVENLLDHWTPSEGTCFNHPVVTHSNPADLVSAFGTEAKVEEATLETNFPDFCIIGKTMPTGDGPSLLTKGPCKTSRKGVGGFLRRAWKAVKRVVICGCGRTASDLQ